MASLLLCPAVVLALLLLVRPALGSESSGQGEINRFAKSARRAKQTNSNICHFFDFVDLSVRSSAVMAAALER